MESKTKNRKTRQQIEAMAARAFDGMALAAGEDAIVEMKDGWFNASYRVGLADGRDVILKIAPPAGSEVLTYESNIMTTEVASMRLVDGTRPFRCPRSTFRRCPRPVRLGLLLHGEGRWRQPRARQGGHGSGGTRGDRPADRRDHSSGQTPSPARFSVTTETRSCARPPGGRPSSRSWSRSSTTAPARLSSMTRLRQIRVAVRNHAAALDEIATPCLVHWDAWDPNWFVRDGKVAASSTSSGRSGLSH